MLHTAAQLTASCTPHAPSGRRLPPSVVSVELSCIRDWLPQPLSQLAGLRRLHVRRGLVSEGVLLTEYQALQHLTGGWRACVCVSRVASWMRVQRY